jgi:hypothetical protein
MNIKQIWLNINISTSSMLRISTCSEATTFDTVLALVDGQATILIAINDDAHSECFDSAVEDCGSGDYEDSGNEGDFEKAEDGSVAYGMSVIGCIGVEAGEYWVVVSGSGEAEGEFEVTIDANSLSEFHHTPWHQLYISLHTSHHTCCCILLFRLNERVRSSIHCHSFALSLLTHAFIHTHTHICVYI